MKKLLLCALTALAALPMMAVKYAGADISLLPKYEEAKAVYLTENGQTISNVLTFNKEQGMNIMRVRLFVNPANYNGPDKDPNACQSLEYITPLCKRIKDAGFNLLLDFHYSDYWADPAHQWTPTDWVLLSNDQLYSKIHDYTASVLTTLKEAGAEPDFIQTGNEISYGMLWGAWNASASTLKKCFMNSDANWPRFIELLKRSNAACREVCPQAKIIVHIERVATPMVLEDFYTRMDNANLDYDIIGLSYYPYFHGPLSVMETALNTLETKFPTREIMVVETGYPYAWEVPGTTYDYSSVYPYSATGQASFTRDLVNLLKEHANVNGVIWWWAEYNAYRTSLSGWYNAPLFDSRTGRALPATTELCKFADNAGVEGVEADAEEDVNAPWFTIRGQRIDAPTAPGVYLHGKKKVVIK